MQAILTRRSIRKYTSQQVSHETTTELLKAAMSAPTAGNQPWHFVVIRDRTTLDSISKLHPHAEMLKQASAAISISGDPSVGSLEGRWLLDCAAATENILIAANALGLGACWVGIYPVEERIKGLRDLLGIPEHVIPLSMVSLGMPAEKKDPPARFKVDRIHYEKW
ncbi:MAG: nitroreductase family protein [Pseudomonadota bacterium]